MRVRVLTFNVWFEPVHMEVRMEAIGRVVERTRPAVIGFQELTRESLAMLRRQRWAAFYDCSVDAAPPCSEAYFVALFSALPVLEIHALPFANSGMGRELVAVRVELAPGKSLIVGTSHLESMRKFGRLRVAQLQESTELLGRLVENSNASAPVAHECLGAVFMADTNLMRADLRLMDTSICRIAGNIEVEHARSGRSVCRSCDEAIPRREVRVGKIGSYHVRRGKDVDTTWWYHQTCYLNGASADEKRVIQSFVQQIADADAREREEADEKPSRTEDSKQSLASADIKDAAVIGPAGVDLVTLGLPEGWKDLWLSVKGNTDKNGLTFDGKENGHVTKKSFRSRFDRVYFYPGASVRAAFAASSQAVLEDIEVVGKEPISQTLWPSDHFGVIASLKFDAGSEGNSSGRAVNSSMDASVLTPAAAIKDEVKPEVHETGGDCPPTSIANAVSGDTTASAPAIKPELQESGGLRDPLSVAFSTDAAAAAVMLAIANGATTTMPVVIKHGRQEAETRGPGAGPPTKKARRRRKQGRKPAAKKSE